MRVVLRFGEKILGRGKSKGRGSVFLNVVFMIFSNYGLVRFGLWIFRIIENNR